MDAPHSDQREATFPPLTEIPLVPFAVLVSDPPDEVVVVTASGVVVPIAVVGVVTPSTVVGVVVAEVPFTSDAKSFCSVVVIPAVVELMELAA